MFSKAQAQPLSTANRQQLLQLARQSIQLALTSREEFNIDLGATADNLKVAAVSFVTINIDGQLRGCIGSLQAHRSLILDIANMLNLQHSETLDSLLCQ
jgi:AMMECR1 domain-containing protein